MTLKVTLIQNIQFPSVKSEFKVINDQKTEKSRTEIHIDVKIDKWILLS